jgi:hypothetical protein
MMRNLRNIGTIKISLPTDEKGLVSRACPNPECKGGFKVKIGTGIKGENIPCHCPYCGHKNDMSEFNTSEQIEYAKSIAISQIKNALEKDIRDWGRQLERSTRNGFVKLSMDYKSHAQPIRYYQEKQIETFVACDACTLEYAIFGVFAFCPDCGVHNSLQILRKNFELAEKEITLATATEDKEFSKYLISDSLENVVSAFDSFGRATCSAFAEKAPNKERAKDVSFQNIVNAKNRVQTLYGFDLADSLDDNQWASIVRCFQKRHLLAHTMGVIDEDYIKKASDPSAIIGRIISIDSDEVKRLIQLLEIVGGNLHKRLSVL